MKEIKEHEWLNRYYDSGCNIQSRRKSNININGNDDCSSSCSSCCSNRGTWAALWAVLLLALTSGEMLAAISKRAGAARSSEHVLEGNERVFMRNGGRERGGEEV